MEADLLVLPRWKCHKIVRAAKILQVEPRMNGSAVLHTKTLAIVVSPEYCEKHRPVAFGYFVVYDDGYQSFSPAQAFEEGYTLIQEGN